MPDLISLKPATMVRIDPGIGMEYKQLLGDIR